MLASGARIFDGPGAEARPIDDLRAGTPVKLGARGTACVPVDADHCTERWRLASGDRWVEGTAVAVRSTTPGVTDDLGGQLLNGKPWAKDGAHVPDLEWYGVSTITEIESGSPGHTDTQGWLAVKQGPTLYTLQVGDASSWGSAARLTEARWLDLDPDGQADLVVVLSTDVTEVGYGGLVLKVIGPNLAERLSLDVGDVRANGLEQTEWGAVRIAGHSIVHEQIRRIPCGPALEQPGLTCLVDSVKTWTHGGFVGLPTALLPSAGEHVPVLGWIDPEAPAPSEAHPVRVLASKAGAAVWLDEPQLRPAWLAGVFSADRNRATWVEWE